MGQMGHGAMGMGQINWLVLNTPCPIPNFYFAATSMVAAEMTGVSAFTAFHHSNKNGITPPKKPKDTGMK
jgi:hypothetical protein